MDEKKHTPFVVGGNYRRRKDQEYVYGTMLGSKERGNGVRIGEITTAGWTPLTVFADSATLDEWELISQPVSPDVADAIAIASLEREAERNHLLDQIADLIARVTSLELALTNPVAGVVSSPTAAAPTVNFEQGSVGSLRARRKVG